MKWINKLINLFVDGKIDDLAKELDSEGPWTETTENGIRKLTNADGSIELGEF